LNRSGTKKLQIGSGKNLLAGWLNTDIRSGKDVVYLDARKRLPFDTGVFDYVMMEHLIEHLNYEDGSRFANECHRILKPRGKLRISTPDLAFVVQLHSQNIESQNRYVKWTVDTFLSTTISSYRASFAINNFFYGHEHKFLYDFETLKELLERNGFVDVRRCRLHESDDLNLCDVESHGKLIGEEFNEMESLVLEATRPRKGPDFPLMGYHAKSGEP
jgi:predicted SAM-dependent methyltransferase